MKTGWGGTAIAVVAALAATVWAATGLAWACVPQAELVTVQPRSSGPAGTAVTVAALGFDPGRAEVRWNAVDGEMLATAEGPEFSVPVTIPRAPEGLYHLIVLARAPGGEIGNTSTVSFQVTAPSDGASPGGSPAPPTPPDGRTGSSTTSMSVAAVGLAAGAGAMAALCSFGGLLALRRHRNAPSHTFEADGD